MQRKTVVLPSWQALAFTIHNAHGYQKVQKVDLVKARVDRDAVTGRPRLLLHCTHPRLSVIVPFYCTQNLLHPRLCHCPDFLRYRLQVTVNFYNS